MRRREGSCLAAACCLALTLWGCTDRTTLPSAVLETSGTMGVYAGDSAVNVSAANAEFSELRVFNRTTGQWIELLSGRHRTVDLVAAHDDAARGFVGNYQVPPGDYDRVDATILPITFTMSEAPRRTCIATNDFPRRVSLTFEAPLHLSENGLVKLELGIAKLEGSCSSEGGNGRLMFEPVVVATR